MRVPTRPRRAALLCVHFTRNLAYYRAGWDAGEPMFPKNDLWSTVNSNFLDIAVLDWCKLFADKRALHCWRKVVVDPSSFLPQLYSDCGASKRDWDEYVCGMREYRNKFLAHLDKKNLMHIPEMDLAQFAIYYLYDTMRAEQIDGVLNNLPRRLREYSDECALSAAKFYALAA